MEELYDADSSFQDYSKPLFKTSHQIIILDFDGFRRYLNLKQGAFLLLACTNSNPRRRVFLATGADMLEGFQFAMKKLPREAE